MRVLIIESDEAFASTLRQALEARGVDVEITADGDDGIRRAQSKPTSAVVLSVELGERLTGGFTWCNRFKRDANLREIPLLLTSALATEETFEQHRKLKTRADGYQLKPYGPRDLLNWLEPYLPQPPAPEEDPGTFDLAGELLAGLDDPAETEGQDAALTDVDILDTDDLIADIFDEVEGSGDAEGGDSLDAEGATPVETALAADDEDGVFLEGIDGPITADDLDQVESPSDEDREGGDLIETSSEAETDPAAAGDNTPVENVLSETAHGDDGAVGGFDATSPGLLHAPLSMKDPPWSDPVAAELVSGGPALELQLAALRADAELSPKLRERLEQLERENERLGADLASALGASTARENRVTEIEQELALAKAENLTLNARASLLEEELAAALERASSAEARLEAGSRRREELLASLAATAALLEAASREES